MAFEKKDLLNILRENGTADKRKEKLNALNNQQKQEALNICNVLLAKNNELIDPTIDLKELLGEAKIALEEPTKKSSLEAPATQIDVKTIEKYFGDKQKYKIDHDEHGAMVVSRIDTSGKEKETKPFLTVENNPDSKNCTIHTNGECSKEEYKGMINAVKDSRTGENKNKPIFFWHENETELKKMIAAADEAGVKYKATLNKEEFNSPEWKKAALAQPDKDKTLHIEPRENSNSGGEIKATPRAGN